MRPINSLYKEYEDMTSGLATPVRRKTESLPTKKFSDLQESAKVKELSKRKNRICFEDSDETEADDIDRSISTLAMQPDAWKTVTTLKTEIGRSHMKSIENTDKTLSMSKTGLPSDPLKALETIKFTSFGRHSLS